MKFFFKISSHLNNVLFFLVIKLWF